MADAYDFQINTLKFRCRITDKTPYTRGTAPFRKEQFDSSPTVGDQSLSGWWARGQMSFHKGAGLNFYEVLESETVLNRFKSSLSVRTFVPGELSLDIKYDTGTPANIEHIAITDGNYVYKQTGDTGARYGGDLSAAGTAVAMNGGGVTCTAVTGQKSGSAYWYAITSANNVQRFFGSSYDSTIYTHGQALKTVHYAKDRLWIIDALRDLYAVSGDPAGAPVALSSPVCRLRDLKTTLWTSLADGGGSVFLANGQFIYSFTPAADGSLAALSAPSIAAILPDGETISTIAHHMGLLVIVTSAGVRFASILGSDLAIGPLSIEWLGTTCRNVATRGTRVYVTGYEQVGVTSDEYTNGWEFDISEPREPGSLIYPYRLVYRHQDASPPLSGAVAGLGTGEDAQPTWFAGVVVNRNTSLYKSTTGFLYTAQHRFGTLDLKHFQEVTVWARGTTGNIQVYSVQNDWTGTETLLGTLNMVGAGLANATYSFGLSGPQQSMGLKFVLNTDASSTLGPTLLGYQIRALPVPKRQRILKVPLVILDKIRLRRGSEAGKTGRAYSDLAALEALESSGAVVTFTDHRTGETGSAYIDSVDFQGETPSTSTTNGFGGVAYVTLRVLS